MDRRRSEAEARAERRVRAVEETLEVRPLTGRPYVTAEVRNPVHETHYTTYFPGFPDREGALCTCEDFARRGIGTCKHIEAAGLFLSEHPPPPPAKPDGLQVEERWAEIDRREEGWPTDPRALALKYRGPGSALYVRLR
ncbi:MAG: hypothetical protein L3K09_00715 [Thermoplasmata archaeon]|nr:hypothetical protein [Thermoplasmata archaeon]